jgi:hypothetical protein
MSNVPNAVIRAAEARATGWSWPAAAKEAGWTLTGLRRWIRDHEKLWYRELYRARREARDIACDEAVAVLRKQLRAEEDKTTFQAAATLATKVGSRAGQRRAAKAGAAPTTMTELLDAMTEDEWAAFEPHVDAAEEADRIEDEVIPDCGEG